MADTALTEQVFHLQQAALSSATKKAYQAGSKRYYAFCKKYHIIPFPTTELTLCYFAAYLSRSVQHPTVRLYLAAVRSEQLRQGWPELPKNTAQLSQLLQGLKRCARPRTRLALTPATLNQLIHGVLNNRKLSKHDRYLYAAAISLAYFGCLRVGEISYPTTKRFQSNKHLTVGDIELVQNSIKLYLKQSKTDQAGIGTKIVIGQSGHDIIMSSKNHVKVPPAYTQQTCKQERRILPLEGWLPTNTSKATNGNACNSLLPGPPCGALWDTQSAHWCCHSRC